MLMTDTEHRTMTCLRYTGVDSEVIDPLQVWDVLYSVVVSFTQGFVNICPFLLTPPKSLPQQANEVWTTPVNLKVYMRNDLIYLTCDWTCQINDVQWWFVYPDTFAPGLYFWIKEWLLNRPLVRTWKSVPTFFSRLARFRDYRSPD